MREILLLGASGSIGSQTIDLLSASPERFSLRGFSVGKRVENVGRILSLFPSVNFVCVQRKEDYDRLAQEYPNLHWYWGDEGLLSIIRDCPSDMVVNALVGFAGLFPSVEALKRDKILALANKESLVVGGDIIRDLLSKGHGKLYPIDSEHVAIAKLLSRIPREDIAKIWITASGGSFRDFTREELRHVTPADALKHPTWSMGAKITIDSATMMNKGFEVIEAKVLFDFPLEQTGILMHQESHVHSVVEMKDGTFVGDVSVPDMHGPIAYALWEGNLDFSLMHVARLEDFGPYHFGVYDPKRYHAPEIALRAFAMGGTSRAVLNGANEAAVYAFLEGRIPFLSIDDLVEKALEALPSIPNPSLEEIAKADKEARAFIEEQVKGVHSCR
ncbi:MAG: 1-deoxy-D-xylulose-5-phosphate reductoisomerase [Candidatus Enteromonas sp.]|nr:1-deoxy-D-xylulose-5-phosphate reductoisomerase [Candidatus Enteromonas sp.]